MVTPTQQASYGKRHEYRKPMECVATRAWIYVAQKKVTAIIATTELTVQKIRWICIEK